MTGEQEQRAITALDWLVTDAKWKYDIDEDVLNDGIPGGYPDDLQDAINLLLELKGVDE